MIEDVLERVRVKMRLLRMTSRELAQVLGYSESYVRNVLNEQFGVTELFTERVRGVWDDLDSRVLELRIKIKTKPKE